jgi:hypothetical protein
VWSARQSSLRSRTSFNPWLLTGLGFQAGITNISGPGFKAIEFSNEEKETDTTE